jgi:hypothetical protein
VDGGARRQQRDLVRFGRCIRVGIERRRAAGGFRHPAQVLGSVHARELLVGRRTRRHDLDAPRAPASGDGIHDLGALGTLGVAGRRLMFGEAIGMHEEDGHDNLILFPEPHLLVSAHGQNGSRGGVRGPARGRHPRSTG